jgi:hypothetical protein
MTTSAALLPSVLFVYRTPGRYNFTEIALNIAEARDLDPNSTGEIELFGSTFYYAGAR